MAHVQISILPSTTNARTAFPEWIVQHCTLKSKVLDIGAGRDRNQAGAYIKPHIAQLVGVDPSEDIKSNPSVDEGYQASLEHFASGRKGDYDCLYSMFVVEHVADPIAFLSSCRSLLKSNGMLFGVTPNLWHYLGISAKMSARLGLEDWLLGRLVGKNVKEDYHFPTTYRMNSIPALARALEMSGFKDIEFRCFDPPRNLEFYFPSPLKWFPRVYAYLVYAFHLSHYMGYFMFRATAS